MDGVRRARVIVCSLSPGAQHAPSIAIIIIPSLIRLESECQQVNE